MNPKLVAGNWKMNKTLAEARSLVAELRSGLGSSSTTDGVEVLICPPATLLFPMAKAVAGSRIGLGAQNVHDAMHGAFTGELSVTMVRDTGCSYVIIGHSERRQRFGETDDWIARKVNAVIAGGLTALICVGETAEQRDQGKTISVVDGQLSAVLGQTVSAGKLVIAYEPVWAIGAGRRAAIEQVAEVHRLIRNRLVDRFGRELGRTVRVLYGGSVNPDNAADLLSEQDVDGALVGGASLDAKGFLAIITAAAEVMDRGAGHGGS